MEKSRNKVKNITFTAFFAALIAVCSYISLPIMTVPITLQTFAVFSALLFAGGKNGTLSIAVYILLGAVGAPVFSGFRGGVSALFGLTGGYIIGFLLMGLVFLLSEKLFGNNLTVRVVSLMAGLIVCYAFGTGWFIFIYNMSGEIIGLKGALGLCVFPFMIPDMIKLICAIVLYRILYPVIGRM